MRTWYFIGIGLACWPLVSVARGDVFNMPSGQTSLGFVTVGDVGNTGDTSYLPNYGVGAVGYVYGMGKYDVTAAQYAVFLNAVARSGDAFGLYDPNMANAASAGTSSVGCGIVRTGTAGNYSYSVSAANANLPANWTSFADAVRFANWLSNGQPNTGAEDGTTTENGSYDLSHVGTDPYLVNVTRKAGATYVVPSESEWYKAAYYKAGGLNAGYWTFATKSDSPPTNTLNAGGTNNVNFLVGSTYTDPTTYLTAVGAMGSPSAYGTHDQTGDVWQWTDTFSGLLSSRVLRGDSFDDPRSPQTYLTRNNVTSTLDLANEGFRIALVGAPEPGTLAVLGVAAVLLKRRR